MGRESFRAEMTDKRWQAFLWAGLLACLSVFLPSQLSVWLSVWLAGWLAGGETNQTTKQTMSAAAEGWWRALHRGQFGGRGAMAGS